MNKKVVGVVLVALALTVLIGVNFNRVKDNLSTAILGSTSNVTRESAVKMATESCGKTVTANKKNWFKPYEDLYNKEGVNKILDIHKDWKKQITREEAFALLAELCDIAPVTYKNTWTDGGGKYAGHMQALYDKGIVTAEKNGKLNAKGLIDSASFTKITNVANTIVKSGGQDWVSGEPGGEIGGGGAGSVNSGDPGGE